MESGEEIDIMDPSKRTPLFYAGMCGEVATVKELLRLGADCKTEDKYLLFNFYFFYI